MKTRVSFTFEDQDDKEEIPLILKYMSAKIAISDFRDLLRNKIKYESLSEEQYEFVNKLREDFYTCFKNNECEEFLG